MKKFLIALLFPITAHAQLFPPGVPENCFAPMSHDMARNGIPGLLHVSDNSLNHITDITFTKNSEAFDLGGGHYRINCKVNVKWSSGASDNGYWFSIWEDPDGELQVYYGRNL
jgi:hypothetical protein